MADNSFLSPGSLDFVDIKENLKNYLKGQKTFKDFDFEGSNISVLLDVLAYNTYMNGFYLNMVGNEMFLDSALMRDSLVSHAKDLNYFPRSAGSAQAVVDVNIRVTNPTVQSVTIPAYTEFNSSYNGTTYVFTNDESIIVNRSLANTFSVSALSIYEGVVVTERFTVLPASSQKQRFILSNKNVDASSIRVTVYSSNTSTTGTQYDRAESLLGLQPTSKVFFVQAAASDKYEILFGDDVFGAALSAGNVARITYRVTKGEDANGVSTFNGPSVSGYTTTVVTINSATGGSAIEDIETIRYRAPRYFTAQDRAVTSDDYEAIVLKEFPYVKNMTVYGGETVTSSPQYGRVFISAVTDDGTNLTNTQKNDIKNFLKKKTFLSLETFFEDPDYTYIDLSVSAVVSKTLQRYSLLDMRSKIISAVKKFNENNLQDFKTTFRFSKLASTVDAVDEAIISTQIDVRLVKQYTPILNFDENKTLMYNCKIVPGSLTTSTFYYLMNNVERISTLIDDNGILKIRSTSATGSEITNTNVGTVDYETGKVAIQLLNVSNFDGPGLRVYVEPDNQDVTSTYNQVIEIDEQYGLNVVVTQESN